MQRELAASGHQRVCQIMLTVLCQIILKVTRQMQRLGRRAERLKKRIQNNVGVENNPYHAPLALWPGLMPRQPGGRDFGIDLFHGHGL